MRSLRAWCAMSLLPLTLAALLGGCAGSSAAHGQGSQTSTRATTFAIDQDFPDPDVLHVGDTYYAYATNSPAANVQVATSHDARSWSMASTDAMPDLPAWALPGKTWAPDVVEVAPGQYVMYVVVASAKPALQCIAAAVSRRPEGPFRPVGRGPLVCPVDQGGAIDPSTFRDADGSRYLLWKNDGNCCGLDTWLQIARLSGNGLALEGRPTRLLKQGADWEGSVVEAPVLVRHGSGYVLFYSANNYAGGSYAIGYATAASATGRYTKHPVPLLSTQSSGGRFVGPGGQDVVTLPDGRDLLVFHSWDPAGVYRGMNVLPLTWHDGEPTVAP